MDHWVISGPVKGNEEGPASPVTSVLITAVQKVGMKEEGIATLQLHVDEGKNL